MVPAKRSVSTKQARLALCGPRVEASPESLNHLVRLLVLAVVGEPHSVVHVYLHHPPNEQLQLVLVGHVQHIGYSMSPNPFMNAQNYSTFFFLEPIFCISGYRQNPMMHFSNIKHTFLSRDGIPIPFYE